MAREAPESDAHAVYRQAEQMFRDALGKNPESPGILAQLGRCLALQGKAEEALEYYLSSLESDPGQPGLILRTGDLYASQGCYEEAMRFYEHYEHLRPDSARGYARMGDCLMELGFSWSAADAYSLALDREPHNPRLKGYLDQIIEICLAEI